QLVIEGLQANPDLLVLHVQLSILFALLTTLWRRAANGALIRVAPATRGPTPPHSRYSMTFATTPAPTVRPPSRIAKRSPSSIAIGDISVTVICVLSPGITISVPPGNSTLPVTSVVRK